MSAPTEEIPVTASPETVCGVDDERILTFGLLLEAHARLTKLLDVELRRSDDISLQTFEVLLRIAREPDARVTMSKLAAAVALTTGGVTRLADRLTEDGFVERVTCPDDRRVVWLTLTQKGWDTLRVATEHHLDHLEQHVQSRIAKKDLNAVHRALDALRTDPT